MSRIRADKIKRKPIKNNIIDLEITKLAQKKDETFYPYNSKKWKISFLDNKNIYLNHLFENEVDFNNKIQLVIDFKHFILINKNILSESVFRSYYNSLKKLLQFSKENDIKINSFKDINYEILILYTNYLSHINASMSIYDSIRALLKRLAKTEDITLDKSIKNNVFPTANLPVTKNIITPYTEEEFQYLAKFITSSLTSYFDNKKEFGYKNFCKCAYWYLSILTGLNKTGLNSLVIESIEKIKETEDLNIYWVVGEKNRNNKGFQNTLFAIRKDNELFYKVLKELKNNFKKINKEYDNVTLFSYIGLTGHNKYKGSGCDINKLVVFKNYEKQNNFKYKSPVFSTAKIRNFLSASIYHKTKDEKIVSTMLDHSNTKMTKTYYIKHKIDNKIILKFNTVQELMVSFSKNKNFDDWVEFQNALNIKDTDLDTIIKNLKTGFYSSQVGQCIRHKKEIEEVCTSYINCFECKHFSVIGDRDAWKLMSFKEALFELKGQSNEYNWIYSAINEILSNFDKDILMEARNKLNKGRHPFWKNQIVIKNITEQYENNK